MKQNQIVLIVAGVVLGIPILSCSGCLMLGAVIGLVSPPNSSEPVVTRRDAQNEPTATKPKQTVKAVGSQENVIPGIAAVDLTSSLENRGFTTTKRFGAQVEYVCQYKLENSELTAEAFGSSADQLISIKATGVSFSDDTETIREFLGFIATLPFDGNRPALAKQWVLSEFGSNSQTTFGPCSFTLRHAGGSWMLNIRPTN